jgi:NADH-quinone oxidoreductase subunit L
MALHSVLTLPFWLAASGVGLAAFFYLKRQDIPAMLMQKFSWVYAILEHKYGFDEFNDWFFAGGARLLGGGLWKRGDVTVIDGWIVNGAARLVGWFSRLIRPLQSGYIYHYAFAMLIGVFALITWFVRVT